MKTNKILIILILIASILAGCKTQQRKQRPDQHRIAPRVSVCDLTQKSCTAQPNFTTMNISKMSMSINYGQMTFTVKSSIRIATDSLLSISIQPALGIEMFRAEFTPSGFKVYDKMNRRYTSIAYNWSGKEISPQPTYKLLQDIVTSPLTRTKKTSNERTFMVAGHEVGIQCKFSQREYNHLPTPRRTNLKKYKRVSLRDIIPL